MLMVPRRHYTSNLFDEMFRDPFFKELSTETIMKTDIREKDNEYHFEIDLPGYKKEEINAELADGYLTITAKKESSNDEKDNNGNYLRRERYSGECSRSYFVGKGLREEDIKASFNNGILHLTFPKEPEKIEEKKKLIAID